MSHKNKLLRLLQVVNEYAFDNDLNVDSVLNGKDETLKMNIKHDKTSFAEVEFTKRDGSVQHDSDNTKKYVEEFLEFIKKHI